MDGCLLLEENKILATIIRSTATLQYTNLWPFIQCHNTFDLCRYWNTYQILLAKKWLLLQCMIPPCSSRYHYWPSTWTSSGTTAQSVQHHLQCGRNRQYLLVTIHSESTVHDTQWCWWREVRYQWSEHGDSHDSRFHWRLAQISRSVSNTLPRRYRYWKLSTTARRYSSIYWWLKSSMTYAQSKSIIQLPAYSK